MEYNSVFVNLGCGLHTPAGWVNVDGSWSARLAKMPRVKGIMRRLNVFPHYVTDTVWNQDIVVADLRRILPFKTNSVDVAYSSHTLEHFHVEDGKHFMREIHRVLKPGGVCRILVPDGSWAVAEGLLQPLDSDVLSGRVPRVAGSAFERINVGVVGRPAGFMGRMWHRINDMHYHKYLYNEASLISLFEWAGFAQVRKHNCFESRILDISSIELKSRSSDGSLIVEGVRI